MPPPDNNIPSSSSVTLLSKQLSRLIETRDIFELCSNIHLRSYSPASIRGDWFLVLKYSFLLNLKYKKEDLRWLFWLDICRLFFGFIDGSFQNYETILKSHNHLGFMGAVKEALSKTNDISLKLWEDSHITDVGILNGGLAVTNQLTVQELESQLELYGKDL